MRMHLALKDTITTHKAIKIVEAGGWLQLRLEGDRISKLENTIRELTIKDLQGSIFQVKYWGWLLLISSLVGTAVTLLIQALFKVNGIDF